MKSKGLFVISEKEFQDHIYSRKFLLFLGIILAVTIIGMASGSIQYNEQIEQYNENQAEIGDEISWGMFKPSVMTIFSGVGTLLASLGAILGIAMGFDLITKEKESKSLKILLSHPIFRDEVINGKAIGGIIALVAALAVTFLIAFATMLIFSIVPSGSEILLLVLFGFAAFLMIFSYFAISLFMSTVSKDSGSSLVYTLIIFVFLSSLLPVFVWGPTMDLITGPPPEFPEEAMMEVREVAYDSVVVSSSSDGEKVTEVSAYKDPYEDNEVFQQYQEDMRNYWDKRQMISDFINLLSPTNNFQYITGYLTYPQAFSQKEMYYSGIMPGEMKEPEEPGFMDIIGGIWINLLSLIVIPVAFFSAAYIKFMRLDVR
ncbi:ABC transporter permease [Methanoplanus endosymbiosus]|uniref:ABC transporter permease n=1 Tax=Methanoplanus endosymbiosus TaxID=33865 RepID=A0A9E7PMF4_9EURY|nr:ABC transporter permease [Methanoplanus endosymbiosus]UUX92560.1 ABC transporter permease [Methanoplanus endosymbiosus]